MVQLSNRIKEVERVEDDENVSKLKPLLGATSEWEALPRLFAAHWQYLKGNAN